MEFDPKRAGIMQRIKITHFAIVILVVLLRIFLWKPVLGMLEKRRETIQNDLDQAARTNREAQAVKEEYETALTGARQESAALVEQARVQATEKYNAKEK